MFQSICRLTHRHVRRSRELQHNGERIEAFIRRDESSKRKMGKLWFSIDYQFFELFYLATEIDAA